MSKRERARGEHKIDMKSDKKYFRRSITVKNHSQFSSLISCGRKETNDSIENGEAVIEHNLSPMICEGYVQGCIMNESERGNTATKVTNCGVFL